MSSWADQSGLGYVAVQGGAGAQPQLVSNAINGRPVVRFDGSDDFMSLPEFMKNATQGEMFVVLKASQDAPAVARGCPLWLGTPSNSHYPFTDGNVFETFGNTVRFSVGNPAQPLDQFHVFNVSAKTGEWVARFNGREQFRTADNTISFPSPAFPLIGKNNSGHCFAGDIAEILVYDTVLGETREAVLAYLARKYQISDAVIDYDHDGLSDLFELSIGSDPSRADTNGDGLDDGPSYWAGFDPVSSDVDNDGLTLTEEWQRGTDPFNADTDGDHENDLKDPLPLDPSVTSSNAGTPSLPVITLTNPPLGQL